MADDAELIKAGTQGLVEGFLKPYHDLILSIFGPAADELGLMLKDGVKEFRRRRTLRFFGRTSERVQIARIEPRAVPLKILLPILENASIEENDDLQDVWASLLANAADPRPDSLKVLPSFPNILKELTSADVKFLDVLYRRSSELSPRPKSGDLESVTYELEDLFATYSQTGLANRSYYIRPSAEDLSLHLDEVRGDKQSIQVILDSLIRQRLISSMIAPPEITMGYTQPPLKVTYSLTHLGVMFVKACQPPSQDEEKELEPPLQ